MNELIDRYVHEVARRLPAASREDVARELRATIGDMAEDRGSRDDDDVRAVLLELGDPGALAAGYRSGPQYLIGPEVYAPFVETVRAILSVALPVVLVLQILFADWSDDRSVASVVLGAIVGALQVGVHVVVWTALAFVIVERTGTASEVSGAKEDWTPDDLPPRPRQRQITLGDLIGSVVVLALVPAGLLWQRYRSPYEDADGSAIPLFYPDLWDVWFPALIGLVLVTLALEGWKYAVGRWTVPLVAANLVVNAAFVGYFALLFSTEDVWNPAYVAELAERTDFQLVDSPILPMAMASIVIICLWDTADSIVKLRQAPTERLLLEEVPA